MAAAPYAAPPANTWGPNGQMAVPQSVLALLAQGGAGAPAGLATPPQGTWSNGTFTPPQSVLDALAQGSAGVGGAPGRIGGGNVSADPKTLVGGMPEKKYIPSLSAALTGSDHSPSLYQAIDSGTVKDPNWWAEGGPDVGTSLTVGLTNATTKALGLVKITYTM
jgi:hypothetical protein